MRLLIVALSLLSLSLSMSVRDPKNLPYYDYLSPEEYDYDLSSPALERNDISRTVPQAQYDSPIYYIRLPPQPYMFVPGLGYISQPPPPVSPFVSLPINFVANGKPTNIYRWTSGGFGRPQKKPAKRPDSPVHQLEGQFAFNGKPENVMVLRDSYNSLYGDALQNFYP